VGRNGRLHKEDEEQDGGRDRSGQWFYQSSTSFRFISSSSLLQLAQGFAYRGVIIRPLTLSPLLARLPVVRAMP
jgi:hypothetical protein